MQIALTKEPVLAVCRSMSDDAQNLPTREEFHETYQERRQELVDCVNNNTWGEPAVEDAPATPEGMALKVFGKRFGELGRGEQNMIRKVLAGHVREATENIKSLKRNNMLKALERVSHSTKWLKRMEGIIDAQFDLMDDLHDEEVGKDNVFREQTYRKTRAGNAVAQAKHIDRIQTMVDRHIQSCERITKMEEKVGATFIKQGDQNLTVNAITPESVRDEFAEFVEVEDAKEGE